MPPKAKYSKEDIVSAAFAIAREEGIDAVMARSVAEKLGTSTSPVFTAFSGIDELKSCVRERAEELYAAVSEENEEKIPAFLRFCIGMTGFAKAEPGLFGLLFSPSQNGGKIYGKDSFKEQFCSYVSKEYSLSGEDSDFFFTQLWIYTCGLSSLIASGAADMSAAEVRKLLSDEFKAQYVLIKSGKR